MKFQIINYYFDFNGKRYWTEDYDHAIKLYLEVACPIEEHEIMNQNIMHLVKEYEF